MRCETPSPTDKTAQFARQFTLLQGSNDVKEPCYMKFSAHWWDILLLVLNYRNMTAKGRVTVACSSFVLKLQDQISF